MSEELSFAYVKSEGIGGPCEADVQEAFASKNLEIIQLKDVS